MEEYGLGDITFGTPRSVGRFGSVGGNDGRGPVDNVLPTGVVADGTPVRAADAFERGIRRQASFARNTSKARTGEARMSDRG